MKTILPRNSVSGHAGGTHRNGEGESIAEHMGPAWQHIRDSLLIHFPGAPFDGSRRSHAQLQKFGSVLIVYLTEKSSLRFDGDTGRVELQVQPEAVIVAEFFKSLNAFFVIESTTLATMQYGQSADLMYLYAALTEMSTNWLASFEDVHANRRLPARLRGYLTASISSDQEAGYTTTERVRIAVVDYLCGLRDIQAAKLAARLRASRDALSISGRWLDV